MCARDKWPFEDKKFDFVFCSHTLEDVRDPIWVCQELMRVGKAGYIETPSRIIESMLGVERLRYCGYSHHHWLCELTDGGIEFMFKHAPLHSYSKLRISPVLSFGNNSLSHTWIEALDPICGVLVLFNRWFRKVNPKYVSIGMYWSGSFECKEKVLIHKNAIDKDFMDFKAKAESLEDLWVWKRIVVW
ncbi:MAG: methyltransferase domain-containing protein [Nitrospirae bacterium]|nr:methyltransferase domain-containing protein [Nitrospirota bacterium]